MSFLDRLLGRDIPDPAVGQQWKCQRNGEIMKVIDAHMHVSGSTFVTCADWIDAEPWVSIMGGQQWGIGSSYAVGLRHWRQKIKSEKRVLLSAAEMKP